MMLLQYEVDRAIVIVMKCSTVMKCNIVMMGAT